MTVLSEESDIIYKDQKKNCSEMISHFTAVLIICSFDQKDPCSHVCVITPHLLHGMRYKRQHQRMRHQHLRVRAQQRV